MKTDVMYLVYMRYLNNISPPTFLVLTETREEAVHWIELKMEGKQYNGLGVYDIKEIPIWQDML